MTTTQETAVSRVEQAIGLDITVAAQQMIPKLAIYNPARMTDADEVSLNDSGAIISRALAKLRAERLEINRGFDTLKLKTTAKLTAVIDELDAAKTRAGDLMTARRALVRLAAEKVAEDQRREAAAVAARDAKAAPGELTPPPVDIPAPVVRNKSVGSIGTSTGRETLAVKMVTPSLVAIHMAHALKLDEVAAKAEARAALVRARGNRAEAGAAMKLCGIEIYWVDSTAFGTR